jgi:ATP-binding protein involved in chromosome partitioning
MAPKPGPNDLLDALRPVRDPDLRRSIVDLGFVQDLSERKGRVRLVLRVLRTDGAPLQELGQAAADALLGVPGVEGVDLELPPVDDPTRDALGERLRAEGGLSVNTGGPQGAPQAMGHAEGRPVPSSTAGSRTRVIGITSGKGGVGKSSVTVNLAVALAQRGHDVGLLDADVYGYSVPKMLGIDHDPVQLGDLIIPPVAYGVRCISVGFLVESDETPVMWRGPMLHKILEEFLTRVWWDQPEFLLFDMPPGTGDVALSMHNYLPQAEVIVVTTPQPAAQRVAQRSASMAAKVNTPVLGVVENMSWFTGDDGTRYELFGRGGGQELAEKLGVPLIGQIPLVAALREGGDVGVPIVVSDPKSEAATALLDVASWIEAKGPRRRFRSELTVRS